jgi:hypothetical protein
MASDSRVESLLPEVASRSYIEDYILFREFPTVAARYARLVTAGLGTRNTTTGSFGDDKTLGVIGAGDNTSYGVFALYLNEMSPSGEQDQAELDLAWAKQFTSIALGARINWSKSSFENTTNETTSPIGWVPGDGDFNTLGITGGIKFDLSNNGMMELAATLAWLSFENQTAGAQDAGNISYNLAGRIFTDLSDKTTLVPLIRYGSFDLTPEGQTDKTKTDQMNLGVALQRTMNGDDLLIVGLAINYMNVQDGAAGVKSSAWQMPALFMSLEFDIYSWLTGRVGASKPFVSTNDEPISGGGNGEKFFDSSFEFGLGMGLHFNNFDVDANVNPESLFTGGYLFSGDSSNPIGRITATYYW